MRSRSSKGKWKGRLKKGYKYTGERIANSLAVIVKIT